MGQPQARAMAQDMLVDTGVMAVAVSARMTSLNRASEAVRESELGRAPALQGSLAVRQSDGMTLRVLLA